MFEKYQIDYCCGGKQTLAAACEAKNIAVEKILIELQNIDSEDNRSIDPFQLHPIELIGVHSR
ncbi:MAG: DUF542 domain-containing protein [Bacteroidetes bacterium]|nr:DUF542 domain-containing protein [Bacteroidota bacterium]